VVKIQWKGAEVEAVQGLVAYCVRRPGATFINPELDADSPVPKSWHVGVMDIGREIEAEHIEAAAADLGDDVMWTEPVLVDRGALVPNDPSFPQQWGLQHINAQRAWDRWHGNPNSVVLAILDSGISMQAGRLSHPDLGDPSRFTLGPDLVNHDIEPMDDHGHGTHIAGVAAATKNNQLGVSGLWPGQVLIMKVFNGVNLEGNTMIFEQAVSQAIAFARQRGARLVINYSGGGDSSNSRLMAVQNALNNNALIVAAVGNNNPSRIISPASLSTQFANVIAVGAVDQSHRRPAFGNRGPQMTVVAPGVDIFSTLPNYMVQLNNEGKQTKFDVLSGTSQATALVSALAALVWSQSPNLTADQVRARIVSSATRIPGSTNDFGSGLINAEAALS
jgi:thermitase